MIAYNKTKVFLRGEKLDTIWWRGRQWAVTSYGLERLDGTYNIAKSRLQENPNYSWVEHIGKKIWADVEDFATAYLVACAMHGFKMDAAWLTLTKHGYDRAKASHEKSAIRARLFPRDPDKLEVISLGDPIQEAKWDRENAAVEAEYTAIKRRRLESSDSLADL